MKMILFAGALMLGGAAMAQDTTGTTTTTTTMATTGATTVEPSNAAPERDARGIPVVSAAATAPDGWNQGPHPAGTGVAPNASAPSMGAAGDLPACTRKITDHCTQTYERGVRKPG